MTKFAPHILIALLTPPIPIEFVDLGMQVCGYKDPIFSTPFSVCRASVVHMVCGPDTPILPDRTIKFVAQCLRNAEVPSPMSSIIR